VCHAPSSSRRRLHRSREPLQGDWKADRQRARDLGCPELANKTQWVCLRTDGSTPARRAKLDPARIAEAEAYRKLFSQQITAERRAKKQARKALKAANAQMNLIDDLAPDEDAAYATRAVTDVETTAVRTAEQLGFESLPGWMVPR